MRRSVPNLLADQGPRAGEFACTYGGRSPDDVEAYFMLGNVYKRRGLRSRADAMFRRVLDLAPRHAGAAAALATPPETPRSAPAGLLARIRGRE